MSPARTPRVWLAVDLDEVDADWWLDASPADRGVWLTASLLCKRGMTDGWVSRRLLRREGVDDDAIGRLVELGRFEVPDGERVLVVGFLDSNMSMAEYEEKKRQDRERQAKSRAGKAVTRDSDVTGTDTSVTDCDPSQGEGEGEGELSQSESEANTSSAQDSPPSRVRRLAARLARAKADDEKAKAQNPDAFETWCQTTWRDGEGVTKAEELLADHPDLDDDALVCKSRAPSRRPGTEPWPPRIDTPSMTPSEVYAHQQKQYEEHSERLDQEEPADDFEAGLTRARDVLNATELNPKRGPGAR